MSEPMRLLDGLSVVGIAGSLRRAPLNRALLRAAQELAPEGMRIEIEGLGDVPLFNGDLESAALPPAVARLRQASQEPLEARASCGNRSS